MREARRAEVAGYGSREILRPECCLLTTPNQALTQSTRRLALSSSPWPCAHPPTRGPARRDFSRASGTSYIGLEGLRRCSFPLSREPRSLPPLFALAPTKSSDSRSPRRPARSHLEDSPTAPPPPGTFPLAPRSVTRAEIEGAPIVSPPGRPGAVAPAEIGTGMITPRIHAAASYHFTVIPAMAAPGPFRAHQCDVRFVDCQE